MIRMIYSECCKIFRVDKAINVTIGEQHFITNIFFLNNSIALVASIVKEKNIKIYLSY